MIPLFFLSTMRSEVFFYHSLLQGGSALLQTCHGLKPLKPCLSYTHTKKATANFCKINSHKYLSQWAQANRKMRVHLILRCQTSPKLTVLYSHQKNHSVSNSPHLQKHVCYCLVILPSPFNGLEMAYHFLDAVWHWTSPHVTVSYVVSLEKCLFPCFAYLKSGLSITECVFKSIFWMYWCPTIFLLWKYIIPL